jgi:hypothetical protein
MLGHGNIPFNGKSDQLFNTVMKLISKVEEQ